MEGSLFHRLDAALALRAPVREGLGKAVEAVVGDRDHDEGQNGRDREPEDHRDAHRCPKLRTLSARGEGEAEEVDVESERQGNESEDRGHGRQQDRAEPDGARLHHRIVAAQTSLAELADKVAEDDRVVDHDPGERDHPDAGHDDPERGPGQHQPPEHADHRQGDRGDDGERQDQRIELGDQHHHDQQQCDDKGPREEGRRLLFLLVGAGELPPVAGRPNHRVEFGGHFLAHSCLGAAGLADHVTLDRCHPVEVHPAYRGGTNAVLQLGDGPDGNRDSVLVGHGEFADVVQGCPGVGRQPNPDVVLVLTDPVLRGLGAQNAGLHGGGDDLGVDARAHRLLPVHLHAEFGFPALKVVVQVHEPLDAADSGLHLLREPADLVQLVPQDTDRDRSTGGGAVLGSVHLDVGSHDVGESGPHHLHGGEGVADLTVGPLMQVEGDLTLVRAPAAASRINADSRGAHVRHLVLHVHGAGGQFLDAPNDPVGRVEAGAGGRLDIDGDLPGLDLREELHTLPDLGVDANRSNQDGAHHPDPSGAVIGEVRRPAEGTADQAPDEPADPLGREREHAQASEHRHRREQRAGLEKHADQRERHSDSQEQHETCGERPVPKEPGPGPRIRTRAERPLEQATVGTAERVFFRVGLLDPVPRRFHQIGAERRVDDQRHHQRRRKADDERHRQVGHEVADDPRPDQQG